MNSYCLANCSSTHSLLTLSLFLVYFMIMTVLTERERERKREGDLIKEKVK